MKLSCTLNNKKLVADVDPLMRVRDFLVANGCISVRDSDDCEGFAGSDTIIVNGITKYSNLLCCSQIQGADITTSEGLQEDVHKLSILQQALIDAGVVQSAYNSPATAVALQNLLDNNENPSREDVLEALSGIFVRDTGYEHYVLAVKLAVEMKKYGKYKTKIAPSFREDLDIVGKPTSKIDGGYLVKGTAAFVEDRVTENAHHLYMLRSPHAMAYVNKVDIEDALKCKGVDTIITAFNCPDTYYMSAGQGHPEPSPYDRRLFNYKVRHVGDRVAAVIADTLEHAKAAAKKIKVNYEVLKPIFTVEEAMSEGAPVVQDGPAEYVCGAPDNLEEYNKNCDPREGKVIYQFPLHADNRHNVAASAHGAIGDVDKAFEDSDIVLERTYQSSQIQCTPLEPHVVFTKMDGDRLVVHAATQVPYHLKRITARVTGLSENKIHVIKERVGGGYGSKQDILIEEVCAYATYITGLPIYSRNTREEEFIANSTRHPMRVTVKLGAKKDGTLTGVYMDVRANTGPFGNHCLTVPMNACSKTLPLLKCSNMKFDVTTYYTNIPPTGAYQGYGAPKGSFALNGALCELANELDMDFADLIELNKVEEGYMVEILKSLGEGREGVATPVGSCGLDASISEGKKMLNWGKKEEGETDDWKVGKGFAIIQQGSGLPGLDNANAQVKLTEDGSIIVLSGGSDLGTGLDTISAKMACEILKVPMDKITVLSGDTDSTLFDTGAYASSGTYFSGNASRIASEDLKAKILSKAAEMMSSNVEDLEVEAPGKVVNTKTMNELSYYEIIHDGLSGMGKGHLIGTGCFTTTDSAIPYGAHFAQVAVNTRTGELKVQKFFGLQDCGTPINPELALCQMYGASLKSIGHSLYEDMVLDSKGHCKTKTLREYGVPMSTDVPEDFKMKLVYVDDPFGPYGGKSISEIATNGAAPSIANAIYDAVGVYIRDWPFTPEKVLKGLGKIK